MASVCVAFFSFRADVFSFFFCRFLRLPRLIRFIVIILVKPDLALSRASKVSPARSVLCRWLKAGEGRLLSAPPPKNEQIEDRFSEGEKSDKLRRLFCLPSSLGEREVWFRLVAGALPSGCKTTWKHSGRTIPLKNGPWWWTVWPQMKFSFGKRKPRPLKRNFNEGTFTLPLIY